MNFSDVHISIYLSHKYTLVFCIRPADDSLYFSAAVFERFKGDLLIWWTGIRSLCLLYCLLYCTFSISYNIFPCLYYTLFQCPSNFRFCVPRCILVSVMLYGKVILHHIVCRHFPFRCHKSLFLWVFWNSFSAQLPRSRSSRISILSLSTFIQYRSSSCAMYTWPSLTRLPNNYFHYFFYSCITDS